MSKAQYFRHDAAIVESDRVGPGTRIWAFAHVLPGATIGADCNICDHVFIEGGVTVGDRVTVKCGVQLWDGCDIGNDVFIGPNATFSNDRWPRSRAWLDKHPRTVVQDGASIGANATILPGITIGQKAMVGAGAVVTRSVPPHAVVVGNPARIVRYATDSATSAAKPAAAESGLQPALLEGVGFDRFPIVRDLRGNLIARQVGRGIPFVPRRYFLVFDVPSKEVRGEHAHRECHQLLVCLNGTVHCVVDDGEKRQEFVLDSPEKALHIPPMIWGTQYKYSKDSVLLVLASHEYEAGDYIREYDAFCALKNGRK